MTDLIIFVADKDILFTLKGALARPSALGIRPVECEFKVHPGHDGGIRKTGPELLRLFRNSCSHALLICDFEGSGTDQPTAVDLEEELDTRLYPVWGKNAKAIVIEPEIETWIWGSDNSMRQVFQWENDLPVRNWLVRHGFSFHQNGKPMRPKEALNTILRNQCIPHSSALFCEIATKISLKKCVDPAFLRLRDQLVTWFPRQKARSTSQ